jgi:hypothetical protein
VHSERTLRRKLVGNACEKAREHLRSALYDRRTRRGCEESVEAAIRAAPDRSKNYIRTRWLAHAERWANYARCDSALLQQIATTNAVESWHASLKRGLKKELPRWALTATCSHVAKIASQWADRAEEARLQVSFPLFFDIY